MQKAFDSRTSCNLRGSVIVVTMGTATMYTNRVQSWMELKPGVWYVAVVLSLLVLTDSLFAQPKANASGQLVYVDPDGVIRWKTTKGEVAMFGANYCLPSASDYRAAGMVHAD